MPQSRFKDAIAEDMLRAVGVADAQHVSDGGCRVVHGFGWKPRERARRDPDEPLEVLVIFRPLACREGVGAVLGGAASRFHFADVPGLPRPRIQG